MHCSSSYCFDFRHLSFNGLMKKTIYSAYLQTNWLFTIGYCLFSSKSSRTSWIVNFSDNFFPPFSCKHFFRLSKYFRFIIDWGFDATLLRTLLSWRCRIWMAAKHRSEENSVIYHGHQSRRRELSDFINFICFSFSKFRSSSSTHRFLKSYITLF